MPDEQPEPGAAEYAPVMPFVLCESNGGPYDDGAFVAGFTSGALYAELRGLRGSGEIPREQYINAAYLPQVDLIAMMFGFTIKVGEQVGQSEWRSVAFEVSTREIPDA